jgi:thiol-disulfide isomerase/thioredoxin
LDGIWIVAFGLQWIVILLLAFLIVDILRYLRAVQDTLYNMTPMVSTVGLKERAPFFTLPSLSGNTINTQHLFGQATPVLLLFLSSTCNSCKKVIQHLTELGEDTKDFSELSWKVVIVYYGGFSAVQDIFTEAEILYRASKNGNLVVLVDEEGIASKKYGIRSFPTGFALDSNGLVVQQAGGVSADWIYTVAGILKPIMPSTTSKTTIEFSGERSN